MFIVTKEWMVAHKSPKGGFYACQTKALGEYYPLTSGWFDRCIGKEITDAQKRVFEAGAISKSHARKVAKETRKAKRNLEKTIKTTPNKPLFSRPAITNKSKTNTEFAAEVAKQKPSKPVASFESSAAFLNTYEWRRVRMQALKKYGPKCMCCGATPNEGAVMNVDHIKPRKLFPQLALDLDNLQILCHDCNHGKGNWDMTDWRPDLEYQKAVENYVIQLPNI